MKSAHARLPIPYTSMLIGLATFCFCDGSIHAPTQRPTLGGMCDRIAARLGRLDPEMSLKLLADGKQLKRSGFIIDDAREDFGVAIVRKAHLLQFDGRALSWAHLSLLTNALYGFTIGVSPWRRHLNWNALTSAAE